MPLVEELLPSTSRDVRVPRGTGSVDVYFARIGRDGVDELERLLTVVESVPFLQDIIDAMPIPVAILNDKGQVLLMNRCWSQSRRGGADCGLGKRLGELLDCLHVSEGPDGCGTSQSCGDCGAAVTIEASTRSGGQATRVYRLERPTPEGPDAASFRVSSTGLALNGERFFVLAIQELGKAAL